MRDYYERFMATLSGGEERNEEDEGDEPTAGNLPDSYYKDYLP
jgi:hypothetical protein